MNCNGRKNGTDGPKVEPGEWAGEGYCKAPAGRGTTHPGEGRCKHHGGLRERDDRLNTGLYSEHAPDSLRDRLETIGETGDVEDMADEIQFMRGVVAELSNSLGEGIGNAEEAERLVSMLDRVSRAIARLHKIRYGEKKTIRVEQVQEVVVEIQQVVREQFETCDNAVELITAIGDVLEEPRE